MLLPSGHIFLKFFGVGALELFRADPIAEQNVVVVHEDVGQLLYQLHPHVFIRFLRRAF